LDLFKFLFLTLIDKYAKPDTIDFSEGSVIFFDKPEGLTSFDIIRRIRRIIKIKKIGHAGTLDPLATGLMILCTGKMTKKINLYQGMEKVYEGMMYLGASTASYDRETPVLAQYDLSGIDHKKLYDEVKNFRGEIEQIPPLYSALKVDGVRLYKKAHRGEHAEIKSRKVFVHEFEITGIDLPYLNFFVRCSKGTYIRSLAHDFGKALNAGAYLFSLRRVKIGDYHVKDAINFELLNEYLKKCEIKSL